MVGFVDSAMFLHLYSHVIFSCLTPPFNKSSFEQAAGMLFK